MELTWVGYDWSCNKLTLTIGRAAAKLPQSVHLNKENQFPTNSNFLAWKNYSMRFSLNLSISSTRPHPKWTHPHLLPVNPQLAPTCHCACSCFLPRKERFKAHWHCPKLGFIKSIKWNQQDKGIKIVKCICSHLMICMQDCSTLELEAHYQRCWQTFNPKTPIWHTIWRMLKCRQGTVWQYCHLGNDLENAGALMSHGVPYK